MEPVCQWAREGAAEAKGDMTSFPCSPGICSEAEQTLEFEFPYFGGKTCLEKKTEQDVILKHILE